MIICFNCPTETKQSLDILLQTGQYKDYGEIISVAVENLVLLGQEVSENGPIVIGSAGSADTHPNGAFAAAPSLSGFPKKSRTVEARKKHSPVPPKPLESKALSLPVLFLLGDPPERPRSFAPVPGEPEGIGEEPTLDQWIFGQCNKLLPAKANCRALARLIVEYPEGVPLDVAAKRISEAAVQLGDYLADLDQRRGVNRDDAFATAFPRSNRDAEKSRTRYATQFLGYVSKEGRLSGLLHDYKLANLARGSEPRFLLTEAGWTFAMLPNPVLDAGDGHEVQRFGQEEIAFLLNHIRKDIPVEEFAFRVVLSALASGADTPEKIDTALKRLAPNAAGRSLTSSYLTSQRSGAISRMADVELVARHRTGVRVRYSLSPHAHGFGI